MGRPGTFQPGQSGNPGGRPPVVREFRDRCQQFMQTKGWKQLEQLANDADSPHQFRAVELITAYAYGKPTQPVSGDEEAAPIRVSVTFDDASQHEVS